MKKILILSVVVLSLLCSGSAVFAQGDGVDMNEYTCGDLMKEKPEDIGLILMWVDGYISCETGDLRLDSEWIMEMATTINEECAGREDKYLVDIVEDMAREE